MDLKSAYEKQKEVISSMNFRHEWKHRINYCDLLCLRQRLRPLMSADPHAPEGAYRVRSLYFDNLEDKALREKLDGVSRREKFRLRMYNCDAALINLEKKSKLGGLCAKEICRLSHEELKAAMHGDPSALTASEKPLVRELGHKMLTEGLMPRTVVDYVREPFVYAPGNVRVTLDYDLRTALSPAVFLDPGCVHLDPPDSAIILEVKWDEFLPDIIRDAVQVPSARTAPYSKYAVCRAFG